jgi:hypothetical protein
MWYYVKKLCLLCGSILFAEYGILVLLFSN